MDQELTEKNAELEALNALCSDPNAVSYTHLDVYKRQHLECAWQNGFTPLTVGCPILIGDGLKGTDDVEVLSHKRNLQIESTSGRIAGRGHRQKPATNRTGFHCGYV